MSTNVSAADRPKVDRAATPEDPIYYRVTKSTAYYPSEPYDLTWKDVERLSRYKASAAWTGFKTREEAVAYAEGRGWTKVKTWKEAEELAKPALAAISKARVERAQAADRASFVTEDQVVAMARALTPGEEILKVRIGRDGQLRARVVQERTY